METFYTILYCPIRPVIDERLSVALLLRAESKVFFRYSRDKLKIIKELLPQPAYNLLKSSLRNIEKCFKNNCLDYSSPQNMFPMYAQDRGILSKNFLKREYVEYLNSYTNNLLHFSSPKKIDVEATEETFDILYHKLISAFDSDNIEKKHLVTEDVKETINPKIKAHVNLDVELTSRQVANLIVPTSLWFIGKNDQDVTGEVIDFEKSTHHLENDIREHLYLLQSLRNTQLHYHGKHFLVGVEPKKASNVNHTIWQNVRSLSYISYITPNEVEAITEYIQSHNVAPFFNEEE